MKIFPAIDLYGGKAVRLFKGDYSKMTVYSENPLEVARDFEQKGAEFIHLVDLEGAKDGTTPNFETVKSIAENTRLFTEIGGGIRSMETVEKYLGAGVDRVILGTAASWRLRAGQRRPLTAALTSAKKCVRPALKPLSAPIFQRTARCRAPTESCTASLQKNSISI